MNQINSIHVDIIWPSKQYGLEISCSRETSSVVRLSCSELVTMLRYKSRAVTAVDPDPHESIHFPSWIRIQEVKI